MIFFRPRFVRFVPGSNISKYFEKEKPRIPGKKNKPGILSRILGVFKYSKNK